MSAAPARLEGAAATSPRPLRPGLLLREALSGGINKQSAVIGSFRGAPG